MSRPPARRGVPDQRVQCVGKEGLSERDAREIAKRIHRQKGSRVNAYRCHCGAWHVGSVNPVQRKAMVDSKTRKQRGEDDE